MQQICRTIGTTTIAAITITVTVILSLHLQELQGQLVVEEVVLAVQVGDACTALCASGSGHALLTWDSCTAVGVTDISICHCLG